MDLHYFSPPPSFSYLFFIFFSFDFNKIVLFPFIALPKLERHTAVPDEVDSQQREFETILLIKK